jgi:23S rRNA (adenine2503-C2)-methyltransferase
MNELLVGPEGSRLTDAKRSDEDTLAKINLYDLDREGMAQQLAEWGWSDYYASLLWHYLYREDVTDFRHMEQLRPELQAELLAHARTEIPVTEQAQVSRDGTRKFLLRLADRETIETVLMPYGNRFSACLSTQVGCAMGCVFCATGQMGFVRHLSAGEIVGQFLHARRAAAGLPGTRSLRNVVFMGMGEPLHNYEETMRAVRILTDDSGLALAPRHITVSTVGVVPGIRRLANETIPVNLAVSLHAATDEERAALVPPGRRWPLATLIAACREYIRQRGKRIFFEWTLIAGQNDTPAQADALGRLLRGLDAHVNLIPLNPTSQYGGIPSQSPTISRFKEILDDYGLPNTVRQRRGIDIAAGCGQLRERALTT